MKNVEEVNRLIEKMLVEGKTLSGLSGEELLVLYRGRGVGLTSKVIGAVENEVVRRMEKGKG